MPLRPFDIVNDQVELPDEINNILVDHNLQAAPAPVESKITDARKIFDQSGAGIQNAAKQISNILTSAEKEADRLKAADMILKVHGILNEIDEKSAPQIVINIQGEGNKTLVNLVLPTV